MLYAIQQKTRSEIVATNVKRVAHGAVITLNVVGVVASFGSLAAAETVAGTLWATTCLVSDVALLSTEFMSESEMKALHDDPTTRNLYYACHAVALIQLGKAGWDFLLPKCQNDIAKAEKAMKDLETYAANKGKTKLKNATTECINGFCFTADTRIATEHGAMPIEKITKNTKVWSWDFEKNALSLQRVVQTFERTTTKLIHLFIGKDTIHTTPEHPFYVPQQEEERYASTENNIVNNSEKGAWVAAKNLRKGMKVFLLSTLLATVDSTFAQDTICSVYNFEVENTHNYFVGKEGVLVHNICSVEQFLKLSRQDQLLEIKSWWATKYPAFFGRGRFIEDAVQKLHFDDLGHIDANDVYKNFETIDNFKPKLEFLNWKFVDNKIPETIHCETAVSIKSTITTDFDSWHSSVKSNLTSLRDKAGVLGGFTEKSKRVVYDKGKMLIIVEDSNFATAKDWIPKLKLKYPTLDFEVNTLENLLK